MSDPVRMILSPVRHRNGAVSEDGSGGVPGSVTIQADCGHQAWISPGGMEVLVTNSNSKTVCANCIPPQEIMKMWEAGQMRMSEPVERNLGDVLTPEIAAMMREVIEKNRR